MIHIEILNEFGKFKNLQLTTNLVKLQDVKLIHRYLLHFLYTTNELSERKSKKNSTTSNYIKKNIKYPGTNQTKEAKHLYCKSVGH